MNTITYRKLTTEMLRLMNQRCPLDKTRDNNVRLIQSIMQGVPIKALLFILKTHASLILMVAFLKITL